MATAEQTVHVSEFTNEPFIDFTKPENRSRMGEALKKVKSEFGREYPMWLNGQKVTTTDKRTSTNPSRPSEVIGVFQNATKEMARQAVEDAHRYFDTWKRFSAQEFSVRDHGGNDRGIAGYGEYRDPEAGGGFTDHRGKIHRHSV